MGLFSLEKLFGITIRESANDGSDFTNPDADYRRLFLGEDGQLHVKDSAGAVTDIGVSSGSVATDAIWDAAGDLAQGTGANTAAKLTLGAAGLLLKSTGSAAAWAFPTFRGAKAYADAAQTVNGTAILTLNQEEYDTDAYHSTVTNTGRMTIPSGLDGYYLLQGGTLFQTGGSWLGFVLNGATNLRGFAPGQTANYAQIQTVAHLVATDYVELNANTGSSVSVGSTASHGETWFAITFLGV